MSDQKNDDEFVERRERSRLIHRFQRKTDPSLWVPGIATIVISAAILWAVAELNSVRQLNVGIKSILAWQSEVVDWQDEYELRINALELTVKRPLLSHPSHNYNKGSARMTYIHEAKATE